MKQGSMTLTCCMNEIMLRPSSLTKSCLYVYICKLQGPAVRMASFAVHIWIMLDWGVAI